MRELPYLAIAILCLAFFSTVILSTNYLIYSNASDIVNQYYPYLILLKDSITAGTLPLWNPLLMGGFPWFGNPDSNLFYLPTLAFTIVFPPYLALNYLIIFHVFLAGIFMFLYLREIKIPSQVSIFGAISFMFSGFIITRIYAGHFSIINTITWIPLIFLLIEKSAKNHLTIFPMSLGLVLGMQFLGSQPQIFIYTLIVASGYYIFRHMYQTSKAEIIKKAIIVFVFLFGISAIQLLPSYEFFKHSVRSGGLSYDQIISSSLPPHQLISLILPEFFGTALDFTTWGASNFWELTGYVGILPIVFSLLAFITKRDKLTIFFTSLAIFSILYSFGKFNPLFNVVEFIPFLNSFRIPARFLLFFVFSISVLASIGLNRFLTAPHCAKSLIKIIFTGSIVTVGILILSMVFKENILTFAEVLAKSRLTEAALIDPISPTITSLLEKEGIAYFTTRIYSHILGNFMVLTISFISIVFVYHLLSKRIIKKNQALAFIIMILVLDLFSFGLKYISTNQTSSEVTLGLPEDTASYRILSLPESYLIDQAELAKRGIQRFDGYYVAKLSYYNEFFEIAKERSTLLQIGNVKYIYANNGTPKYQDSLPRAFFVYGDKVPTSGNHLEIMKQPDFDPTKILLIGDSVVDIKKIAPLKITDYEPNSLEIEVNNTDKGFLVLLDTWYPGWKAYIGSEEVPVKRAYYIMRGVEITSSIGNIRFNFEPRLLTVGAVVTTITILATIIIIFVVIRKSKYKSVIQWTTKYQ